MIELPLSEGAPNGVSLRRPKVAGVSLSGTENTVGTDSVAVASSFVLIGDRPSRLPVRWSQRTQP